MKTIQMEVHKYKETVLKPGVVYDIEDDAFAQDLIGRGAAEEVGPQAAEAATETPEEVI